MRPMAAVKTLLGIPDNLDLLGSSPVHCGKGTSYAHTSYYAASSGAGVFASGSLSVIRRTGHFHPPF